MADRPTLSIDGHSVPFDEGDSVMDAARREGVFIPHLCYHPELSAHGSCRLCTVEIDGRAQAACLTRAREGMVVDNAGEELQQQRKLMIELFFAEGNHFCPSCELSGNCELQALAYHFAIDHMRFPLQYPARPMDGSHPDIFLDRDRCINCALCCRASAELDGKHVFSLAGRGHQSYLQVHSPDASLGRSALEAGDRAAGICPVGALFAKRGNYSQRPGERRYDRQDIATLPFEPGPDATEEGAS